MPSGPWEKFQQQPEGAKPWEKFGAPPPAASAESIDAEQPQGSKIHRFLMPLGIDTEDISAHPNAYNPFSSQYWQRAKANNQPLQPATARELIPFGRTEQHLENNDFMGALGEVTPGILAAATMFGPESAEAMPRLGRAGFAGVKAATKAAIPDFIGKPVRAGIGAARESLAASAPKPGMDALSESVPEPIDALSEEASKPQPVHYPDQGFMPKQSGLLRYPSMERPLVKPKPPFQMPKLADPTGYLDPLELETPYRLGPGQVPSDDVGSPNPNVLAGGKGIIVRKPLQLKAAPLSRPMTADAIDDMGVNQEMMQRAIDEDRAAFRADRSERTGDIDLGVPKWKRLAEFRAQMAADAVMKEAELARQIPERPTPTRIPRTKAKTPLGEPQATADEDLLPKLEESVRLAREKKAQRGNQ